VLMIIWCVSSDSSVLQSLWVVAVQIPVVLLHYSAMFQLDAVYSVSFFTCKILYIYELKFNS
jgi:hypothetical protein